MVKADAYGLGAEEVVRALGAVFGDGPSDLAARTLNAAAPQPEAPWGLGVATVEEGLALRRAGVASRVLCASPVLPEELAAMQQARMIPALHRADDIAAWQTLGGGPWHLAIDTGLNRAGVRWEEAASLKGAVAQSPPQGVFTHFHSARSTNGSRELQESRFVSAVEALALPDDVLKHTDNSYALLARETGRWDLVRPGIALYGSPSESALGVEPVVSVFARVVDVRDVPPGESVSYEALWTAEQPSRIATVAIGHADGYRQQFTNRAQMHLRGAAVPVVGLIAMDMTMLDVTGHACEVGDVVTVLGEELPLDALAATGDLSPYELLVGWRLRLPRVYRSGT